MSLPRIAFQSEESRSLPRTALIAFRSAALASSLTPKDALKAPLQDEEGHVAEVRVCVCVCVWKEWGVGVG